MHTDPPTALSKHNTRICTLCMYVQAIQTSITYQRSPCHMHGLYCTVDQEILLLAQANTQIIHVTVQAYNMAKVISHEN